ncbi:MAG: FHA domain-containing protein [Aquificales bacterium]|nr:FHA domain-containing protein [Aquificales bacterium]
MKTSGIGVHTTVNIDPAADGLQTYSSCQEYLAHLDQGDICFILEKNQAPIILRNVSETIVGRFFDDPENNNLDLDPFGGGAFGVSRRHARIVRINNQFVFEDLSSTNGSWLNGKRLPSGTTYPLMSGDQVWLGQLKLQICFHQVEVAPKTIIFLRDTAASSKNLTPDSLITKIGPYLKAISDMQQIAARCLRQELTEVAIEKIDASGSDPYIVVSIVNNPESIHLIRKWVTPWRNEQQDGVESIDTNESRQAIVQLTSKIIADLAPGLNNESQFTLIEEALPTITELATSSIELLFEAA